MELMSEYSNRAFGANMPIGACPSRGGVGPEAVGDGNGNDRIFNMQPGDGTLSTALGFAAKYALPAGKPAVMISDYAANQAICPDHGLTGTIDQNGILANRANPSHIDYNWPRNNNYQRFRTYDLSRPVRISDITDGTSYTLLLGEISMDTRMYRSGCLSYRDGFFAGGVEVSRALNTNGVCATQNVYADQKCDGIGWTTFRGMWGTPHAGGATIGDERAGRRRDHGAGRPRRRHRRPGRRPQPLTPSRPPSRRDPLRGAAGMARAPVRTADAAG